jgi:fatty-acid desaturase
MPPHASNVLQDAGPAVATQTTVVALPETAANRGAKSAATRVPVGEEVRMGRAANYGGINWITAGFIGAFHVGAVAALFYFSWSRLAVAAVLWILAINFGIGVCYHRLLTHRGFQTPKWVEYLLTICATLSLEGGPIFWVAVHRVHHQHSDHTGDPHTPKEGPWWAHIGWMVLGKSMHAKTSALARYVPDLARDRFHVWMSKYHWLTLVACGVVLFGLGAWIDHGVMGGVKMVLWGVFLRVTLGLHATWLVNSATHIWGSRRFETRDDSRNSFWVALLTGGEGWHNNHHAHPVSARHGLAWYEVDPNFYLIWMLSKFGLARKIQVARYDKSNPKPAGVQH